MWLKCAVHGRQERDVVAVCSTWQTGKRCGYSVQYMVDRKDMWLQCAIHGRHVRDVVSVQYMADRKEMWLQCAVHGRQERDVVTMCCTWQTCKRCG